MSQERLLKEIMSVRGEMRKLEDYHSDIVKEYRNHKRKLSQRLWQLDVAYADGEESAEPLLDIMADKPASGGLE